MKLPSQIRVFNKHILNPLLGRVARSAHGPFAIVRHVGRKSGRTYETTIIVFPAVGGFVIALTYGTEVDWYRNVLAAGRCEIVWHGKTYLIDRNTPVTRSQAQPLLRQPMQSILKLVATNDFARMYIAASSLETSASG